ncbi:MAG: dihydroorotase [Ginsengibacter sp.]
MQKYLFKNISVVNEGKISVTDVLTEGDRIKKIDRMINVREKVNEINGEGKHLIPGIMDDQVHFREPGLTHKGTIYSESKAAVAGGVTSFMEMPNTIPNALTGKLLEEKYAIAAQTSLANYSFYMGTSNHNSDDVLRMNDKRKDVCGVKIFMGSSTGDMLVNDKNSLNRIFSESELLIATHCEDENIIRNNYEKLKNEKGSLDPADHPRIRNEDACYSSSSDAIALARKYGSRLHILHISTAKELELFDRHIPLAQKKITCEVCVHHLHFTADDYEKLGYLIKCNPAIKNSAHKQALWKGLLDGTLDVIATDHAPHTPDEKKPPYELAHSGLPLVQHALGIMLHYYHDGKISLQKIVEKMSHSVADCFMVNERGYIREGYFADLVVADLERKNTIMKDNILYKCGWSPLEGVILPNPVTHTFVNGQCVFNCTDDALGGTWDESSKGKRLTFNR